MEKKLKNPCIRCGKERVFKRKWEEVLNCGSVLTHIDMVCPDDQCQEIVEEEFTQKREKRIFLEQKRMGNIAFKRTEKKKLAASRVAI